MDLDMYMEGKLGNGVLAAERGWPSCWTGPTR